MLQYFCLLIDVEKDTKNCKKKKYIQTEQDGKQNEWSVVMG